jgi:HD-like signal output (HDOD) protein
MIPSSVYGAIPIILWIVILLLSTAGILFWLYRPGRLTSAEPREGSEAREIPEAGGPATDSGLAQIPYTTQTIEGFAAEELKLAFGVIRFDYQIRDEHAAVLSRVDEAADLSVHQKDYFPRRPMLLPKLMQALNDPEVSRESLVKLILEDPAIAGGVLQQANTAFYRVSPARVDNIDRAVWLLGTDGLKRLMATAIMQPVFRLPKGYFDSFAPLTWEHAQRAAAAAECHAKHNGESDPFVAQLLAVLEPLARIVIFRLTTEKYRESPNILPRAEVFIRAMQRHSARVALRIAAAWEMSDQSTNALREQAKRVSPQNMLPLSQAVYFASLAATLSVLVSRDKVTQDAAVNSLVEQGMPREDAHALIATALISHQPG